MNTPKPKNDSQPRTSLGSYTSDQISEMRDALVATYNDDAAALALEVLSRMSARELSRMHKALARLKADPEYMPPL